MHLRFRLSSLVATLVPAALILAPLPAPAAPPPAAAGDATPWLYRGSDVPQDKEWVFGELPNGLRYAVRRNGVPPGQVSIRIRMDVGSLYEQENEKGYSHLLEHLVFRQSKYLGDGQAIPTWQRLGRPSAATPMPRPDRSRPLSSSICRGLPPSRSTNPSSCCPA